MLKNKQPNLYLSSPTISTVFFFFHNLNPLCPMMRFLLFKTHLMTFSRHLVILSTSLSPLPRVPARNLCFLHSFNFTVSFNLSLLCKPLMLGLCSAQPACLMRYMYKSIFLLPVFHSAVSSTFLLILRSKVLKNRSELIS